MNISIERVTIASIFVECILYGFFTFMFAVSVYVLLIRRRNKRELVNRRMVIVSVAMFILATVHVGADLQRVLVAFLDPDDATAYLSEVNSPLFLLKSTAYAMQTLVGDGFLLYRLFLIWAGDKRVCTPILITFVASIGVAIGTLQAFARASPTAPIFTSHLQKWIASFFTLTLFTNFSCTLLIAFRILWVHKQSAGLRVGGTSVFPAAMIIVESGMIYSACLVILIALYLSGDIAKDIVLDAVTPVIGIVFTLIIVRVGLGLSAHATVISTRAAISTFAAPPFGKSNRDIRINELQQDVQGSHAHRQNFTASIFGGEETGTQCNEFVILAGNETTMTGSSTVILARRESLKETTASFEEQASIDHRSESSQDREDKIHPDTDAETTFHPFDDTIKRRCTEAGCTEHHELLDQVTQTVELHTV